MLLCKHIYMRGCRGVCPEDGACMPAGRGWAARSLQCQSWMASRCGYLEPQGILLWMAINQSRTREASCKISHDASRMAMREALSMWTIKRMLELQTALNLGWSPG